MSFLGPSKMRMNQKTHQLKQYKTRGHVDPFDGAIKINITFSKCARVKERKSENRRNQGIGVSFGIFRQLLVKTMAKVLCKIPECKSGLPPQDYVTPKSSR